MRCRRRRRSHSYGEEEGCHILQSDHVNLYGVEATEPQFLFVFEVKKPMFFLVAD